MIKVNTGKVYIFFSTTFSVYNHESELKAINSARRNKNTVVKTITDSDLLFTATGTVELFEEKFILIIQKRMSDNEYISKIHTLEIEKRENKVIEFKYNNKSEEIIYFAVPVDSQIYYEYYGNLYVDIVIKENNKTIGYCLIKLDYDFESTVNGKIIKQAYFPDFIKKDLDRFRVNFDVFTSEQSLYDKGEVENILNSFQKNNNC